MSLKMGPMLLPSYKQEWEKTMAQRYKDGNFPSSGPDCFEAWLSERAYSLRDSLNYANAKAGKAEQEARAYKKQRNIALVLCAVFFAIALLFATRPASAAPAAKAAVGSSVSAMQQSSRMLRSLFLMVLFLRFLCNRLIWSLQFFCSLTRLLRPPPFSCGTLPQQQNGDSVASPCPLPTA